MNTSLSHLFIEKKENKPSRIAVGVFDLDGNILATNTPCYVIDITTGELVGIPAHQFDQHPELITGPLAQYRWMDNMEDSMVHFRDFATHGAHQGPDHLIQDIQDAIDDNLYSPSFTAFKETFLVRARLFAIITARGHSADNLARAIQTINENLLSDSEKNEQYHNIQKIYRQLYPGTDSIDRDHAINFYFQELISYYAVSNQHIMKMLGIDVRKSSSEKKTLCMDHYIQDIKTRILCPLRIQDTPLAIGFSDDSVSNMSAMMEYFLQKRKMGVLGENTVHLYFSGKQGALHIPEGEHIEVSEEAAMTTIEL